jgi:hypothetical protein
MVTAFPRTPILRIRAYIYMYIYIHVVFNGNDAWIETRWFHGRRTEMRHLWDWQSHGHLIHRDHGDSRRNINHFTGWHSHLEKISCFCCKNTILDKSSTHPPALINPCLWLNFAYLTLMKWRINPAILGYGDVYCDTTTGGFPWTNGHSSCEETHLEDQQWMFLSLEHHVNPGKITTADR